MQKHDSLDRESEASLARMAEQEQVLSNRVPGVKIVVVVLSSKGMVYDMDSLRQKVLLSYPDSAVFFMTTDGRPVGVPAIPRQVDLLIDFTGPGQRQGLFFARKLRRLARFAVGRKAGLFRAKIYNRVFDEIAKAGELPRDMLGRERVVQRKVLALAGVAFVQAGDALPDRGKVIALELPALKRL